VKKMRKAIRREAKNQRPHLFPGMSRHCKHLQMTTRWSDHKPYRLATKIRWIPYQWLWTLSGADALAQRAEFPILKTHHPQKGLPLAAKC
jgi:hypothetical protein